MGIMGIFLIMGNAGCISSAVPLGCSLFVLGIFTGCLCTVDDVPMALFVSVGSPHLN